MTTITEAEANVGTVLEPPPTLDTTSGSLIQSHIGSLFILRAMSPGADRAGQGSSKSSSALILPKLAQLWTGQVRAARAGVLENFSAI